MLNVQHNFYYEYVQACFVIHVDIVTLKISWLEIL